MRDPFNQNQGDRTGLDRLRKACSGLSPIKREGNFSAAKILHNLPLFSADRHPHQPERVFADHQVMAGEGLRSKRAVINRPAFISGFLIGFFFRHFKGRDTRIRPFAGKGQPPRPCPEP